MLISIINQKGGFPHSFVAFSWQSSRRTIMEILTIYIPSSFISMTDATPNIPTTMAIESIIPSFDGFLQSLLQRIVGFIPKILSFGNVSHTIFYFIIYSAFINRANIVTAH